VLGVEDDVEVDDAHWVGGVPRQGPRGGVRVGTRAAGGRRTLTRQPHRDRRVVVEVGRARGHLRDEAEVKAVHPGGAAPDREHVNDSPRLFEELAISLVDKDPGKGRLEGSRRGLAGLLPESQSHHSGHHDPTDQDDSDDNPGYEGCGRARCDPRHGFNPSWVRRLAIVGPTDL
jgi:hypothetical protein